MHSLESLRELRAMQSFMDHIRYRPRGLDHSPGIVIARVRYNPKTREYTVMPDRGQSAQ